MFTVHSTSTSQTARHKPEPSDIQQTNNTTLGQLQHNQFPSFLPTQCARFRPILCGSLIAAAAVAAKNSRLGYTHEPNGRGRDWKGRRGTAVGPSQASSNKGPCYNAKSRVGQSRRYEGKTKRMAESGGGAQGSRVVAVLLPMRGKWKCWHWPDEMKWSKVLLRRYSACRRQ